MQSKMDIPEKLVIQSTQDGEKHNTTRAAHHHTEHHLQSEFATGHLAESILINYDTRIPSLLP